MIYIIIIKNKTTTNTGAVVTGVLTATSFSGDGSSLSNLPAGAPVGGASTNKVFFENDKLVEVNYQITSTKNAMSAGLGINQCWNCSHGSIRMFVDYRINIDEEIILCQ